MNPADLRGKFLSEINMAELERPIVVIAHFEGIGPLPQNPAVHFQVTVDPSKVSPSGAFIAFDSANGDQLFGWMQRSMIRVDEVLRVGQKDAKLEVVPDAA